MADLCDNLRNRLQEAKRARNGALTDNALAAEAGRSEPYTDEDMVSLRQRVDEAAREARQAGCDIDDLVGPNVGTLD